MSVSPGVLCHCCFLADRFTQLELYTLTPAIAEALIRSPAAVRDLHSFGFRDYFNSADTFHRVLGCMPVLTHLHNGLLFGCAFALPLRLPTVQVLDANGNNLPPFVAAVLRVFRGNFTARNI